MIGRDARDAGENEWREFAQSWRREQMQVLAANLARVIAAHPSLGRAPLVGAGCGRFLVEAMALHEGRGFIDFGELADPPGADRVRKEWIATCAPSVAVALLAALGVPERVVVQSHGEAAR
jgi:hypothetical protein